MISSSRDQLATLVFVVVVALIAIARFRVLAAGGAPPTIDAGDWLAHGDALFGVDIRPAGIVYPPLVPVLVKLAVATLGLTAGISLVGAVAAIAPAVGLYLALRMMGVGYLAVAPAVLLAGASSIGEATAWGGFPQLIGLGLTPIVLVLVDRALRSWTVPDALRAGLVMMLLLATSHFVSFVAAIAIAVLAVIRLVEKETPSPRRMLEASVAFIVPLLWLIPTYLSLAQAFGGVDREFRFFNELTWEGLWDQMEFLYRDLPIVWRPLLLTAIVAPFLLLRRRTSQIWRITAATVVAIGIALAMTKEGRFVYFLTPYAALAIGLLISEVAPMVIAKWPRFSGTRVGAALAALILLIGFVQVDAGTDFFEGQRGYYGVLTEGLVEGIEEVGRTTAPEAVLAITSLNDAPVGRWVEAIADRETYYGSPLQWLLFDVDLERSGQANTWFVPPFPEVEKVRAAAATGVDLILVPTRWVFYDESILSEFTSAHPEAVDILNEELVVIDPSGLSE